MDEKDYIVLLEQRRENFLFFLNHATRCFKSKQINDCLIYLKLAAEIAATTHIGDFYNSKLELMLKEIARDLFSDQQYPEINKIEDNPRRIIHIATEIYEVGGHTRLMLNWVDGDEQDENHILLTNRRVQDYPSKLLNMYQKRFRIMNTGLFNGDERIRKIREIALKYDYIVLHIHPEDIYTYIALVDINRPVIFLNHADHRFWLGRDISNLFLEIREEGAKISSERRGIPESHQQLFPIPLKNPIVKTKQEARNQLNIPQDRLVVLSIASAHKYLHLEEVELEETLIEVANGVDNVEFIFIGPSENSRDWKRVVKLCGGKVTVLGEVTEVDEYYLAADIYLDSYPVSSLTSLLDAAKYGVALIGVEKNRGTLDIDDISLDKKFMESNLNSLKTELINMLSNPNVLESKRNLYKDNIYKDHFIKYRRNILNDIYIQARRNQILKSVDIEHEFTQLDKNLTFMYSSEKKPLLFSLKLWNKYFNNLSIKEQEVFLKFLDDIRMSK